MAFRANLPKTGRINLPRRVTGKNAVAVVDSQYFTVSSGVNGSASGSQAVISVTANTGTATGGSGAVDGTGAGLQAALSITSNNATASVNVTASSTQGLISVTANLGTASGSGLATAAQGNISALSNSASASGSGLVEALQGIISLSPNGATASGDGLAEGLQALLNVIANNVTAEGTSETKRRRGGLAGSQLRRKKKSLSEVIDKPIEQIYQELIGSDEKYEVQAIIESVEDWKTNKEAIAKIIQIYLDFIDDEELEILLLA